MTLPVESQMLLNGALDPNDPMTGAMMGGNAQMANPYDMGATPYTKPRSFSHSYGGMSATLAPSALDMQPRHHDYSHHPSAELTAPASAPPSHLSFDYSDFNKGQMFGSGHSSQGSGTATPGLDAGWDAFINDSSWSENVT